MFFQRHVPLFSGQVSFFEGALFGVIKRDAKHRVSQIPIATCPTPMNCVTPILIITSDPQRCELVWEVTPGGELY